MYNPMQSSKKAFTLIELLVVIAVIALLLSVLLPALKEAKRVARKAVCLAHQKQMTLGWIMYADNNDDKLVKGNNWIDYPGYPDSVVGEGWIKGFWDPDIDIQLARMKAGALWPYIEVEEMYRCQEANKDEMWSFSIVHSMNNPHQIGGPSRWMRKISQITQSSGRIVFVDDYAYNGDAAWAAFYDVERWWNPLPGRHGNGTTLSFADAHSEYWKWHDMRSRDFSKLSWSDAESIRWDSSRLAESIAYSQGNPDLHRTIMTLSPVRAMVTISGSWCSSLTCRKTTT